MKMGSYGLALINQIALDYSEEQWLKLENNRWICNKTQFFN